ncbi:diaminopimelate epimerase [Clostridium sp. Marseille-P299]|uniref:diaminopimelate epimerase n=1 Tax=Clostridium sp. Marseille-P299 TaxID=1805477 RepID=UPI000830A14E|nr:diaminopimelate epimerase [Clostridium sp. Marseille-P299]
MRFSKMQGCGNDYVYVNCFTEDIKDPNELAKKVSDRHFGIGSDGLVLIKPSTEGDFTMHMYNADGSQSEMCGNAIRCVGKYVYDHKMTDKTHLSIETLAGMKYLDLSVEGDKVVEVTVDMGSPILEPENIPVNVSGTRVIQYPIKVEDKEYEITCVSMGNPHAVVFVEDTKKVDIENIGPKFEHHELFPKRINTEFVQIIDRKHINMRVWERGTGETFACGTGANASAYACILNGFTEDEVTVHMLGGDLKIRYDRELNRLFMTGPAVTVFEGEYYTN